MSPQWLVDLEDLAVKGDGDQTESLSRVIGELVFQAIVAVLTILVTVVYRGAR